MAFRHRAIALEIICAREERANFSLVNRGDGSVVVNPVKTVWGTTVAEVFVQLKPDYEQEIHVNTEMVMAGVATLDNPDICPSAEYLKMACCD